MAVVTGGAGPLLELDGIEKSYAGVAALRGARLTIGRPGTVHTLTGQNGCGKSSLLGILSGQLQPDRGQIRIGAGGAFQRRVRTQSGRGSRWWPRRPPSRKT